jgi:hypothetical protein
VTHTGGIKRIKYEVDGLFPKKFSFFLTFSLEIGRARMTEESPAQKNQSVDLGIHTLSNVLIGSLLQRRHRR